MDKETAYENMGEFEKRRAIEEPLLMGCWRETKNGNLCFSDHVFFSVINRQCDRYGVFLNVRHSGFERWGKKRFARLEEAKRHALRTMTTLLKKYSMMGGDCPRRLRMNIEDYAKLVMTDEAKNEEGERA